MVGVLIGGEEDEWSGDEEKDGSVCFRLFLLRWTLQIRRAPNPLSKINVNIILILIIDRSIGPVLFHSKR